MAGGEEGGGPGGGREGGRGERGRVNKQTGVMCPRTKADRGFDIGTVVIVGGVCVCFSPPSRWSLLNFEHWLAD